MAGRSQHRDNRSSYFSTDLGRSGVYDSVNGTPLNFLQRGDNPNDSRNIEGISETARESGLYASRIGSIKQPTEDYSKEQMLGSTGNFHKQNWDQSFEEGNKTPESGTYSRNIESHQHDMDYKVNNDIGRSSTFDNTRDSGLYSRKIGSFRETISDKDVATPFPENHGLDNQRQSSKSFKPNKYIGNTLDTMLEGEDESKQAEHFSSTNYSESRKYSDTARNGDYDGHSNASFQDDKEFPPWAGMVVDQQFADKYIKTKWPRISLHLTHTRQSDPFVPGKIDEGSIRTIDENNGTDDHRTRNTLCVIGLGTLLLCLVGAAIITIILLANQSTDKTEYVKVNMTVTIDKDFPPELKDLTSTEYKIFTTEFCSEIRNVYNINNSSLDGYHGCKVNSLMNGSIIVNYIIYFTGTTNQLVTAQTVETILITHLNVTAYQLGVLVVITNSVTVHNVETETLSSPPTVERSATTATTTPTIETTTDVAVPSTATMSDSETVQSTEATTLKTKQSTMETTTPTTIQSTTETTTSTIPPTEDTTAETIQSTTETTSPLILSTEEKTPKTTQSTQEITSASFSSTEETTHKTMQTTGETTTSSVSLTDETTPKTMQSSTEIATPSILSTENTTPKTMLSTKETTSPTITSTLESMSSQSTNQVSEKTITPQTSQTTEATQETTSSKTTPTKESISSTTQEETTTLTNIITTSSTETLSDTTTSDSTEKKTTTSSSVPLIDDTTKPVISTSTEDTNQLITFTPTEDTTKHIPSTPTEDTTKLIPSASTEDTTTPVAITATVDTTKSETSTSTEDITQSVTFTSTEDTTKPGTSTPIEDTTKTVSSAPTEDTTPSITAISTEDTTKPVTSTPTEDITKTVSSAPTEDTTPSITAISTEDTTKPVTSTPTEDTTKTVSSAPSEDTTPSITAISTEDATKPVTSTPTEDITKTVSSAPTEDTTPSITSISTTSMSTTEITTSDFITTVSGTTTESQNIGLNCTDSLNGILYSGPVTIFCTIQTSDQFDYIGISHGDGANNSIYGILLNKDGTTLQNYVENQDINVKINSTSTINLSLTFINVSCAMDGLYKVALLRNMSGEMKEAVSRKIQLKVSSPAEKPILTLNADQVIDLIFGNNTNDYYRAEGMHQCEGYVGRPPTNLEINITYDNGTSFDIISNENIHLNISKMSNGCRNKELIKFGLRFSQDMVGAKLRCGVKDSTRDFTLSEELSLIPRNICSCGESGSNRGHPNNCRVYVLCQEADGIMYPTGIACPSNKCRNSITGECTVNCSNSVCEETVPSDFCTTPAPPTTTPAPSPYISCMDVSVLINSSAAVVTCSLNDTATFTSMNVTYKKKGESNVQVIAIIDDTYNTEILAMGDNVTIDISNYIINITILNPSCENEGTFGIVTNINSVSVEDQGTFTVQYPPENPVLQLNADQIIDLGYYRLAEAHSCTGIIGNPAKELLLEILYFNTTEYKKIPVSILQDLKRKKTATGCQIFENITFGLLFSSEMQDSKIRCRPSGNINNNTIAEESLKLIPRDICQCGETGSYRGHPGRCDAYVRCLSSDLLILPYGRACGDGKCRDSLTGICSSNCSYAACNKEVPADFCTTTTIPTTTPVPPKPSVEVSCNGSSITINTGPVDVVCYFNETMYEYINITFKMQNETNPRPVANIQASGTVVMIDQTSNRVIELGVNIIRIRTLNASCDSGGTYGVTVNTGGTPGSAEGILEILTKPDKPSIDQQPHIVDGTLVKYTCTGNVGNPPGSIEFLVRKNGEENFTVSSIASTSSEVTPNNNCNNKQTFYHEHIITSDWNRTTIKCRAVNHRTITEKDDMNLYISAEEELVMITDDYCSPLNETYKYHPLGCNYYVWCVSSTQIFTQKCAAPTCFSFDQSAPCISCINAPPPCNDTSSG